MNPNSRVMHYRRWAGCWSLLCHWDALRGKLGLLSFFLYNLICVESLVNQMGSVLLYLPVMIVYKGNFKSRLLNNNIITTIKLRFQFENKDQSDGASSDTKCSRVSSRFVYCFRRPHIFPPNNLVTYI